MTIEEIIRSLEEQAQDKTSFVDKDDPDDIFTRDIEALREAVKLLRKTEPPNDPLAMEEKPPCYLAEMDNPYPLCVGRGFANCAHCCLWINFDGDPDESRVNPPLTLEELREMDGEPVWVERHSHFDCSPHWALVHVHHNEDVYLTERNCGQILFIIGDKVYRRKPEEAIRQ